MTPERRNGNATGGDAERDPRLDRAYRAGAREEPPAHLDAVILAAAHREAGARPRPLSARLYAWRVPMSIAAVVALSVSVVTLMREEGGGTLDISSYRQDSTTAPAPRAGQEQAKAGQPAARSDAATSSAAAKVAEEAAQRDAAASARRAPQLATEPSARPEAQPPVPAAAPVPRPFPGTASLGQQVVAKPSADVAAEAPARSSVGIRGSSGETASSGASAEAAGSAAPAERQRERAIAGGAVSAFSSMDRPAGAAAPAAKVAPKAENRALKAAPAPHAESGRLAALVKELDAQPAEKWLEKIDVLRREGRKDEAEELVGEFKRRFPDHPLPPVSGNP